MNVAGKGQVGLRVLRNRLYDLRAGAELARTSEEGPLPDFINVGTMKAGTTSLARNLRRHPEIFMPRQEVKFFSAHWYRGIGWYRRVFADGADAKVRGEKTPDYMRTRRAMERIHRVVPNAKIIVLLRDPVARLMSAVNHEISDGRLPRTDRIDAGYLREVIIDDPWHRRRTFDRGFYLREIEGNVLPFFPRERVFIRATDETARAIDRSALGDASKEGQLMGDDASDATRELLADICRFLDVAPFSPEKRFKVTGVREYKAPVTRDARALAFERYEEENERLFAFLGYDIPAWRREIAVHD